MLFQLPDHDTLYKALLARDAKYDGRAYVGVTSTGVFCRLTCPARNPRSENCRFFDSAAACLAAGFRPCRRCHPLRPDAASDPVITRLLSALDQQPDRRWSERDILKMRLDPSTVRRSFKRQFGMTFLEMARLHRVGEAMTVLTGGNRVIDAQHHAGFDSPSGFRDAFARIMGQPPTSFSGRELLKADWIRTPIGSMIAVSDARHLHLLEFVERRILAKELHRLRSMARGELGLGRHPPTDQVEAELGAFFSGKSARFEVPLAMHGTEFTLSVWNALRQIPAGETRSYSDIARAVGRSSAVRAVARANGANPIALVVPCHRVIGMDGSLTGYGGGLWRKQKLIELERQFVSSGRNLPDTS